MLERIVDGRTDLIVPYVEEGHAATSTDATGVALIQWCAYYGDVSAIRFLISHGESLARLGQNLDLNGAAFHGHWKLCQFLIEHGADANHPLDSSGETPLHAALCASNRLSTPLVVRVLLAGGARPDSRTKPSAETGCFMRDCRTKAETPLHRAAAFACEETIQLLLDAGAIVDAKDMHGDTPLAWASWHLRPDSILRKLCYGGITIPVGRVPMNISLIGKPRE